MIQTRIYNILASLGIDTAEIENDEPLMNYMDSLNFAEFIMGIEDEFNISISDMKMGELRTINDAVSHLETSEQRQERLKCNVGRGINNWRCEVDCAFWGGERCTKDDEEDE